MKTIQKPFNNPKARATITGKMEVLVPDELWYKLVAVAKRNPKMTYSWISRFCLFKLTKKANLTSNKKFNRLVYKDLTQSKARSKCHRHIVCFYGSDEVLLKQLAQTVHLDFSRLLRLALNWFLASLERVSRKGEFSFRNDLIETIIRHGTKIAKSIMISVSKQYLYPQKILFLTKPFESSDFW